MAEKGEDPYTDADFERLLELEREDAATGHWTEAKRSPDANVWRKKDPNHDIHLLKGYLKCPGVPAADAVELVTNYELRQKWEKRFYVIKVLEEFPTYKTVYWAVKFPPPCSNRDVVQHIKIKVDGDATMILYKHTTHPAMPEQPGIVRSQTIFSGTIIRPDPNDANSSTISILFQVDLKGWIPAFAINILAASTPLEWRSELVKYHRDVYSKQKSSAHVDSMDDIYAKKFGVRPVINCIGTMTALGGSRMHPSVCEAMQKASRHYVDINELQRKAGERIAKLARAPNGYTAYVSSGASSGLALSVAACMTRGVTTRVRRLPNTRSVTGRVVLIDGGSDTRWNQSLATSGAVVIELGSQRSPMTRIDLESALQAHKESIACFVFFAGGYREGAGLGFDVIRATTSAYQCVLIVDAAAQLPPRSNLWRWTHGGADIVIFSGGKEIGGPQTTGIVLGRRELIRWVAQNGSPNELTFGRPMKTSKESIVGVTVALEIFLRGSDEADFERYEWIVSVIKKGLQGLTGIRSMRIECPKDARIQPNIIPHLFIEIADSGDSQAVVRQDSVYGHSADHGDLLAIEPSSPARTLAYKLIHGNPPVAVNTTSLTELSVNPQTLKREEASVVVQSIRLALKNQSKL